MLRILCSHGSRAFARLAFATLLVSGCSRQPELPRLPSHQPQSLTRRLALDESLEVQDWKELFRSVNREHKLDALKPYVEDPPEAQLSSLAELASKYLYESADKSGELLQLLEIRAKSIAPAQLVQDVGKLVKEPAYPPFGSAILKAAGHRFIPDLLTSSSDWFDDRLWLQVRTARDEARAATPSTSTASYPDWLPGVIRDVGKLLNEPDAPEDMRHVLNLLRDYDLFRPLQQATEEFRKKNEHDRDGLLGAAKGVRRLALMKRELNSPLGGEDTTGLDLLFRFAFETDGPSKGIFTQLSDKLPTLVAAFTPLLRQPAPSELATLTSGHLQRGYVEGEALTPQTWIDLAEGKAPAFQQVFMAADFAARTLAPIPEDFNRWDIAERTRNVRLTAYAIARFVQKAAESHRASWPKPEEAEAFTAAVWNQKNPAVKTKVEVLDASGKLDPRLKQDFAAMGRGGDAEWIQKSFAAHSGELALDFMDTQDGPLTKQLDAIAHRLDSRFSLVRIESTLALMARALSEPDAQATSLLAKLDEPPNMLTTFQNALRGIPYKVWKQLERVIFVDWSFAALPFDTQQQILGVFAGDDETSTKVERLLESIPMVHEADFEVDRLPSLFSLYHRVLQLCNPCGLGSLLSFLGKHALFRASDPSDATTAKYPGFHSVALDTPGLHHGLDIFSRIPAPTMYDIAEKFRASLAEREGRDGTAIHVTFLKEWLTLNAESIAKWLESPRALGGLSDAEMRWIHRFIENGDHVRLWEFFVQYGSLDRTLALIRTLRELAEAGETGYLKEVFAALSRFQNSRLQLLADRLQEWNRTGVLSAWFEAAEALLTPLTPL